MKNPEDLVQVYEDLADRFSTLAEPRRRDHCLVLAAAAALAAGRPEEAERLRQRLLGVNPYHLLCPFASMSEALQSGDVRDYIEDLRRQLPPEIVEQLLQDSAVPAQPVYNLVHHEPGPVTPVELTPLPDPLPRPAPRPAVPPPPRKQAVVPLAPAPSRQTASPVADVPGRRLDDRAATAGRWAATFLFLLAVLLGAAAFFLAFIRPFFE